MKESIGHWYISRMKSICKSNKNPEYLISGLNAWAIGVMRYSGRIINWTKEEFQDIDRKTRKIMTLNSVARLYMKRKEGGGLIKLRTV